MEISVQRWTGKEARALRQAKRMSLKAFAAHLGITDRQLSNWERRGETITIREVNQAALDTSLKVSGADVQQRFARLINLTISVPPATNSDADTPSPHTHSGDGKQMAHIAEGSYRGGEDDESLWLPAFHIDIFPVTNLEYSRFVTAADHPPPQHWPKGRCPDTMFDHPVVYVTWHDATAYAGWAGKQLPTAAQWEKAARGADGDTYPWGDNPTPAKCNTRESGIRATTPVSRYHSGASVYGVYDLCGNVWEWCASETTPDRYELKGGAFTSPFARARPALFNDASADMLDDDTGFRCVTP